MAQALAENLVDDSSEIQDQNPKLKKLEKEEGNENKLTSSEVQKLKEGRITIEQIAQERAQLKKIAEDELDHLVTVNEDEDIVITLAEYKKYKQALEDTDSAEKTRDLLEEIQGLPKEKEKQRTQRAEEEKKLDPEHPKLLEQEKKFTKTCQDNEYLIGENQVPGFIVWFREERKREPTIRHLKELNERLEGKNIYDRGGLAPRREEYSKLTKLFRRYGVSSPLESEYIRREGLSERQEFRRNVEALEHHLENQRDTPFYTPETIKTMMQDILKAKSPAYQNEMFIKARNIARLESETFTHLDDKITINGITIRKMSEASRKMFLDFYGTLGLNKREENIRKWPEFIEAEAKLAQELFKIYKDRPDEFKLAIRSFEQLTYPEKERALKEHEHLVKTAENKEELEKTLIIKAAHAEIDAAARKKIIAPGGTDSTQGKYRKFFEDPENFKNPSTKKPGDLNELRKAYEVLVSPTPQEKYKNLASYEDRRNKYQTKVAKLKELNPDISKEEIQEWYDKYDYEGWTERARLYREELPQAIEKLRIKMAKTAAEEKELGITKSEKKEAKERSPERINLELFINECLAENTQESISKGRKALRLYLISNPNEENDKVILYLEEQLATAARTFGTKKQTEQSQDKELKDEMELLLESDAKIAGDMEEQQITTLNIKGVRQSENLHNKTKSSHERARKESMARVQGDSTEEDLTEDAYKQMGEDYRVTKEGTGEEINTIEFTEPAMTREERQSYKEELYDTQTQIDTKEGFTHMSFKDKSGRILNAEGASEAQEKDLETLKEDLADTAEEKLENKKAVETPEAKIFDLNERMTAERKAKELIDKKRFEKFRHAA